MCTRLPDRKLVAGIFDHTPRMSFVDMQGRRTGLCVEMAEKIAARLSRSVALRTFSHIDSLYAALAEGAIDFVAVELTPDDRAPDGVRYTAPFCSTDVVAYARDAVTASHWRDLNRSDVTLMVGESTSYVEFVPEFLPRARLTVFGRNGLETAAAIADGQADAGLKDLYLAVQYPKVHPSLRILDGVVAHVPVSFVVQQSGDVAAGVDKTLQRLSAEPSFRARRDYWLQGWHWMDDHADPALAEVE